MTLDTYIRTVRFRDECDALEEAFGEVPESILECMKWGAICELAAQIRDPSDRLHCMSLNFNFGGRGEVHSYIQGEGYKAEQFGVLSVDPATPDDIFPHLEHLIAKEPVS